MGVFAMGIAVGYAVRWWLGRREAEPRRTGRVNSGMWQYVDGSGNVTWSYS